MNSKLGLCFLCKPALLAGLVFLAGGSLALLGAGGAAAQSKQLKTIEIGIRTAWTPASAVGLFMSSSGTQQQAVQDIKRINASAIVVSIAYDETSLPKDAFATALAVSETGELAFGEIRPVISPGPRDSSFSLPRCAPEKISDIALHGQLSLLESLVEVRAARRGVMQVKTAQLMNDDFVARLTKLERGFGLSSTSPLSPDLPPVELTARLERILQAVQNLKDRQSKETPPAAKESQPKKK